MTVENDFSKEMLKMWKGSWATYVKTLEAMWYQGEKMLDTMMNRNPFMPEEYKKMLRGWAKQTKESGNTYIEMLNENMKKLEEMLK